jgi:hypothetical protein
MPSHREQQVISEIESIYRDLTQAAVDAEHFAKLYKAELDDTLRREIEEIETNYVDKVALAKSDFEAHVRDAQRYVQDFVHASGYRTLDWSDTAWDGFGVQQNSVREIDPLTGAERDVAGLGRTTDIPQFVRIGKIIPNFKTAQSFYAPALCPLIGDGHIVIMSSGGAKKPALELLQSIITRIVATFPPMSARFVFVDPLGLGDSFPFSKLPDEIRGGMVLSEQDEIREQLRLLTETMKKITTTYLVRDHDSIEAYNQAQKFIIEPYRFLCVADFPAKFDEDSMSRLISIAERGVRTGVYLIIHVNADQQMREFDFPAIARYSSIIEADDNGFRFRTQGSTFSIEPDKQSSSKLFNDIISRVGDQVARFEFTGIPFSDIVGKMGAWWQEDSRERIQVPIGRKGAKDPLWFWLGSVRERSSSHALIAGMVGSGKSTLLHCLINAIALFYSPDEVQLYLLDFKQGVEFKPYADEELPHARVVAIESEPEFGISVFRELVAELTQRAALFKKADVQDITGYRNRTGQKLPRLVTIIDEYQVLFDDSAATRRAREDLETIARQGRVFGIHLILSSQSIVDSIDRNIYAQFATRIALRAANFDRLLDDDNIAGAMALERPGEIIYNDSAGRRGRDDGKGQVALLRERSIPLLLKQLRAYAESQDGYTRSRPLIVFRGNQLTDINSNEQMQRLYSLDEFPLPSDVKKMFDLRDWSESENPALAWLGEAVEIAPHTAAHFRRRSGSNLLIVGDNEEVAYGMLASSLLSLAAFYEPSNVRYFIIDFSRPEDPWSDLVVNFRNEFAFHNVSVGDRRTGKDVVEKVAQMLEDRTQLSEAGEDRLGSPVYFIIGGVQRFRELRSRDNETLEQLKRIVADGPEHGIHSIFWFDSIKNFRSLFDYSLEHFNSRAVLPMSSQDSQDVIGEPFASTLGHFRAILYNNESGDNYAKFKPYALPTSTEERVALFRDHGAMLAKRLV